MTFGRLNAFGRDSVTIGPGERYASADDVVISTVLGSCVAVAVYDQGLGLGGMNHFMLPDAPLDGKLFGSESGRYGMFAMELLLGDLVKLGTRRERLKAKVFGGGMMIEGMDIAKKNVDFAVRYLEEEGIAIEARDVGGAFARRVHFFPAERRVFVKEMRAVRLSELQTEDSYRAAVEAESKSASDLVFFQAGSE